MFESSIISEETSDAVTSTGNLLSWLMAASTSHLRLTCAAWSSRVMAPATPTESAPVCRRLMHVLGQERQNVMGDRHRLILESEMTAVDKVDLGIG